MPNERNWRKWYHHLPDARDLEASAKNCPLCEVILLSRLDQTRSSSESLPAGPIEIHLNLPGSLETVTTICVQFPDATVYLDIFRESGLSSGTWVDNVREFPPPSTQSAEAMTLLKRWLENCLQEHSTVCDVTISGTHINELSEPKLPTRVIDVGPPDGSMEPYLKQSKGSSGFYCTLSHCWGDPELRPFKTTKDNLSDHLKRIPWDHLPKTFQDAIIITRSIGIRWLWIDALCIVQDDSDDWLREAATMGSIYEMARLTIAASHAKDSTEGCFLPCPSLAGPVELSLTTSDPSARIYISQQPSLPDHFPDLGPLNRRAWTTQERLFPRRMIFYTKGGIVWSCRCAVLYDRGGGIYTGLENREVPKYNGSQDQNLNWMNIVTAYTKRALTYPSDILVALQGFVSEFQKLSPLNEFVMGIWWRDADVQLAWVSDKGSQQKISEGLDIPSWSWASRARYIKFPFNQYMGSQFGRCNRKHCYSRIQIEQGKVIIIQSTIKQVSCFAGPFYDIDYHGIMGIQPSDMHRRYWEERYCTPDDCKCLYYPAFIPKGCRFSITDSQGSFVGWAALDDRSIPQEPVYCLEFLSLEQRWGIETAKPIIGTLVLLLKADSATSTFKRVGLGLILLPSWFEDASYQEVRIT